MALKPLLPPVSVNGVTIPSGAIADEAQNHPAPKGKPGLAWRAAARALAVRELLLQEARARGLEPDPQELEPGKWETEAEALVRQVLEEGVEPAEPDEDALRAIYERAPEQFRSPALYEAAHILFPAEKGDLVARAAALSQAKATLAELKKTPRRFAALAAELSACASRENGGMLGQLASGDTVPEFEAALATMEEGTISEAPVETRYGYHLIRLDGRVRGRVLPFDSVRPYLREAHEKAAWVHASRAFVAGLAARADLKGVDLDTPPPQPERESA